MKVRKRNGLFPLKVNPLFVKIWCYFLSLLIPTLIIGLVYYVDFIDKLHRDFEEKLGLHLQSVAATVDINLGTIQAASQSLLDNQTVKRLLKPNSQLMIQERAELGLLIETLQSTNAVMGSLIDMVFTYIDGEKVYSPSGAENFNDFFAKSYRYKLYGAEAWRNKLQSGAMITLLPLSGVDSYAIPRTPVVPFVTTGLIKGSKAVVVANVSVSMVQRALLANNIFPATQFVVADANGSVIFQSPGLDIHTLESLMRRQDAIAPAGELQIDGDSYLASYTQSGVYGWKYYGFTPLTEFNRQASSLLDVIILICSMLMVVGFALSFIFTFRIYNPIKKIRDVLIAAEGESDLPNPGNPRNELTAIGDRVHQLKQLSEMYKSKLAIASQGQLEHSLLHLLQGGRIAHEADINRMLSSQFGFRSADYLCCTIYFEFKDKFYMDIQDVDRIVILSKLSKLVSGLLQEYVPNYAFEYSRHLYVCLLNVQDEEQLHLLNQALNNLMKTFQYDALFCIIHVGVGRSYNGLGALHKSYNEAMTALQNRDPKLDFQVIYAQTLEIKHRFYYAFADENKILNHLRRGDSEAAEESIRDVLRQNELRNVSHHNMHLLQGELYHTVLRYATERQKDYNELVTEEEHLLLCGITQPMANAAELKQELILRLCRQLSEHSVDPDSRVGSMIGSIIRYIEQNYGKDMYLETISQEINVSPKYVSRIFKEKTGMNLTDYISMYRIEKAKELLAQTTDSVNDVSMQVGIYSRATFQRLFKKYEGVSPNEFRKSLPDKQPELTDDIKTLQNR
ncbi:helix-turn-helix domain-containing protein [Paenibacillus thalictri]|nr:helix-turn-helix domain-containing protein [Paenibacillus thalictri]